MRRRDRKITEDQLNAITEWYHKNKVTILAEYSKWDITHEYVVADIRCSSVATHRIFIDTSELSKIIPYPVLQFVITYGICQHTDDSGECVLIPIEPAGMTLGYMDGRRSKQLDLEGCRETAITFNAGRMHSCAGGLGEMFVGLLIESE